MTLDEKKQKYAALCHAMQTGVAFTMEPGDGINLLSKECTPKHLRVGVNSAMVDSSALARLLMAKGVFTEEEYFDALIAAMQEEVDRYQARVNDAHGGGDRIKLV